MRPSLAVMLNRDSASLKGGPDETSDHCRHRPAGGVTKAAVSFALNGQPGVSAATRERILAIAREIGFQPNIAARALTGGKADVFGLVIDRPARTLGIEPFFMQLISGIQAELSEHHVTLLFTVTEDADAEIELYRRWWQQRRVDGVFVVDLRVGDRRIAVLEELRMPAVVIGTPQGSGTLPAVWQDDRACVETVVGYLAEQGHRRIARVGGSGSYWHSVLRSEAFASVAAAAGLSALSVAADYTAEHGAAATTGLLGSAEPPTAILYDSDVMAAAGFGVAQRIGLERAGPGVDCLLGRLRALRADAPRADRVAPGHRRRRVGRRPDAPRAGGRRATRGACRNHPRRSRSG